VFSQTPAQFKGCPNFSDRGTFRYGNRTSIRAHVWPLQHVHAPKVSLLQIILTGTSCAQPKSRAPPLGFYRQCLICLYTSKKLFPAELLRTSTAAYSFHCVTPVPLVYRPTMARSTMARHNRGSARPKNR
jgi:hypothetical protein